MEHDRKINTASMAYTTNVDPCHCMPSQTYDAPPKRNLRGVATVVKVALAVAVLYVLCSSSAQAQDRYHAPRSHQSMSPLKKLEIMQQSVKRRLKTAFGMEHANGQGDATVAKTQNESLGEHLRSGREQSTLLQQRPQPEQSRSVNPSTRQTTGASSRRTHGTVASHTTNNQSHDQVVRASEGNASTGLIRQGHRSPGQYPMRAVEYVEPADHRTTYDNNLRQQLPMDPGYGSVAPGRLPAPPNQGWDGNPNSYSPPPPAAYESARRDYGAGDRAPFARGSVLGDSQITATQHALRLTQENGDLKARLATMTSDNQRLRDRLAETERLLSRSTTAVEAAHEEIDAISADNRELQKNLSDSESRYNRYLLETDRMLQSIREELDDVLVREISANGN